MKTNQSPNIYKQAQRCADLTKTLIMSGNIQRAKRCLQKAELIFNHGTAEVKNAITNVYVFSVSTFMELHHCNIKNLFPDSLRTEYLKQINNSSK